MPRPGANPPGPPKSSNSANNSNPSNASSSGSSTNPQQLFMNLIQSSQNAIANSAATTAPVAAAAPTAPMPPSAGLTVNTAAGKGPATGHNGAPLSYYQLAGDSHWTENLHLDWSQDLFDSHGTPRSNASHLHDREYMAQPANHGGSVDPNDNSMMLDYEQTSKKISDAHTYGPRFCTLYEAYRQKFNLQIDTSRHLMSLCTEHLITFVKWARESDTQVSWISSILLENDYLRPEVRNGVVMVLLYTFASIKATIVENMDMFSTLQDHEQGMGIANKFSLKIYNDPYNFLYFLKTSISALIDAGAIPDNERQNQPKRSKVQFQNRDELQAFATLQKMLIDLLDAGNNAGARSFVAHVTSFWQLRGKFVRNRRFASALAALSQPSLANSMEFGENGGAAADDDNNGEGGSASNAPAAGQKRSFAEAQSRATPDMPVLSRDASSLSVGLEEGEKSTADSANLYSVAKKRAVANTAVPQAMPRVTLALHALRFERVGLQEWEMKETRIYDLPAFVQMLLQMQSALQPSSSSSAICLVDESCLQAELQEMRFVGKNFGMMSLEQELLQRKALLTSWPTKEMKQFQSFLQSWTDFNQHQAQLQHWQQQQQQQKRNQSAGSGDDDDEDDDVDTSAPKPSLKSLLSFWKQQSSARDQRPGAAFASLATSAASQGYIVYEVNMNMMFLIRKNAALGIHEDIWCSIYPSELKESDAQTMQSIGHFLASLFPQLTNVEQRLKAKKAQDEFSPSDIMIKYYPHKLSSASSGAEANSASGSNAAGPSEADADSSSMTIPKQVASQSYQTIGTFATHPNKVIARLMPGPILHDFVLELF